MNNKLFLARLEMHSTTLHSYIAGFPDVYVVAENEEEAKKKLYDNYKEENKRINNIISITEIKKPFIY